jgi:predicted branched-subunit amino acid permease
VSAGFRVGVRAAVPFAIAGGVLAVSFGVLAGDVGMPGWAAIVMSAIVFAGSAQIAALTIIGADTAGVALAGVVAWRGGSVIAVVAVAAVTTALLRAAT